MEYEEIRKLIGVKYPGLAEMNLIGILVMQTEFQRAKLKDAILIGKIIIKDWSEYDKYMHLGVSADDFENVNLFGSIFENVYSKKKKE